MLDYYWLLLYSVDYDDVFYYFSDKQGYLTQATSANSRFFSLSIHQGLVKGIGGKTHFLQIDLV